MIIYKGNATGVLQAAYISKIRIGYIEKHKDDRWGWNLNTIKAGGGREAGIVATEGEAKRALDSALIKWVADAGLQFTEDSK